MHLTEYRFDGLASQLVDGTAIACLKFLPHSNRERPSALGLAAFLGPVLAFFDPSRMSDRDVQLSALVLERCVGFAPVAPIGKAGLRTSTCLFLARLQHGLQQPVVDRLLPKLLRKAVMEEFVPSRK